MIKWYKKKYKEGFEYGLGALINIVNYIIHNNELSHSLLYKTIELIKKRKKGESFSITNSDFEYIFLDFAEIPDYLTVDETESIVNNEKYGLFNIIFDFIVFIDFLNYYEIGYNVLFKNMKLIETVYEFLSKESNKQEYKFFYENIRKGRLNYLTDIDVVCLKEPLIFKKEPNKKYEVVLNEIKVWDRNDLYFKVKDLRKESPQILNLIYEKSLKSLNIKKEGNEEKIVDFIEKDFDNLISETKSFNSYNNLFGDFLHIKNGKQCSSYNHNLYDLFYKKLTKRIKKRIYYLIKFKGLSDKEVFKIIKKEIEFLCKEIRMKLKNDLDLDLINDFGYKFYQKKITLKEKGNLFGLVLKCISEDNEVE